jgi:multidrug resistance efflux pump
VSATAEKTTAIQTPPSLLLRRARYQILPIVTMAACALVAFWLWSRNARSIAAFGEVSGVHVSLESKFEGMLQELPRPVKLFDTVRAGQVVARIDTSAAEAELRQIEAELKSSNNNPALAARSARAEELRSRISARDITSPIDGTVVEILERPGQSAQLAMPIMTIAADRGDFIIGYLRPDQAIRPATGMVVNLRTRGSPVRTMQSYVQSVGPQVQELPKRYFADPDVAEFALPVQIAMPPEADLKPGEVVDLIFRPEEKHSS